MHCSDCIFFASTITLANQSFKTKDLEGTWESNSLASGPGAPWWERGSCLIQDDGSFTVTTTESNGSTQNLSGTFHISPTGIVTVSIGAGQIDPTFQGVPDAGKTIMVATDTWDGPYETGTSELKVFTKMGPAYSQQDLAGTWEVNSLASGPGAPWWLRGSVTVNTDGPFSGTLNESNGTQDDVSGILHISNKGVITSQDINKDFRAVMDSGKTVFVGTATWDDGTTYISIWLKRGNQYSASDLAGTWQIHSLASGPGAPWWERGSITISSDGSYSGILEESDGNQDPVSGSIDISSEGTITSQTIDPDFRAVMDSDKGIIVGTATWDEWKPGTTYISILVKTGKSDTATTFPWLLLLLGN